MSEEQNLAAPLHCDVLVAGAGAAGLSAAHAFAAQGRKVIVVGKIETNLPGRTVALFEGSLRFYRALGLWDRCAQHACPMEGIRLIDDTGSIFKTAPKEFRAREIDLDAFGENIENNALVAELSAAARENPAITLIEEFVEAYDFSSAGVSARLTSGQTIETAFVCAADSRNSLARQTAGITVKSWTYPQVALTVILAHTRPHRNMSTEFHTRSGPFTLVPMPGREGALHRSGLVWLVSPREALRLLALPTESLNAEIEDAAHSILGPMQVDGPIGSWPMGAMKTLAFTAERLALVGETAHAFPPIGAQALNLSLRDTANLVDCVEGVDFDDPNALAEALRRYERQRSMDIGFRTNGIDILNRSLLIDALPVDFLRAATMTVFSSIGPLRRAMMREGVTPHGPTPKLMRAPRSAAARAPTARAAG